MAFVKIWIHAVWGTKNRYPFLTSAIRKELIHHIRENARTKQIHIDYINGYTEHLHCLIGLNADMSIAKTINLIKGESAFWMNKQKLTKSKFEWADEYFAVSVSESMLGKVQDYINNQETHHKKTTFMQEYEEFIKKYKFLNQG
jgi:REP element-mobilizing transposase RayT